MEASRKSQDLTVLQRVAEFGKTDEEETSGQKAQWNHKSTGGNCKVLHSSFFIEQTEVLQRQCWAESTNKY